MYITIDEKNYEVIIERKKIRNTYLRVREDLKIYINTSKFTSDNEIKQILTKEINHIRKLITHQARKQDQSNYILGQEVNIIPVPNLKQPELYNGQFYIKDINKLDNAIKQYAAIVFKQRLDIIYSIFEENIPYPQLKIRKMRSRWGVCNRKNTSVTLNLELIKKEVKYIDYVIIHELSHFIHFNHSSNFWNLVSKYAPDYKLMRKELRE